jgi:hypothetical protein
MSKSKTKKATDIIFFASEVAALVGLHPYRSSSFAKWKVAKRIYRENSVLFSLLSSFTFVRGVATIKTFGPKTKEESEKCRLSIERMMKGKEQEKKRVANDKIKHNNQKTFTKTFKNYFAINGKVDGWNTNGILVEYKFRQPCAMKFEKEKEEEKVKKEYDEIQCWMEMILTDQKQCVLSESFENSTEIRDTIILLPNHDVLHQKIWFPLKHISQRLRQLGEMSTIEKQKEWIEKEFGFKFP